MKEHCVYSKTFCNVHACQVTQVQSIQQHCRVPHNTSHNGAINGAAMLQQVPALAKENGRGATGR